MPIARTRDAATTMPNCVQCAHHLDFRWLDPGTKPGVQCVASPLSSLPQHCDGAGSAVPGTAGMSGRS